MNIKDLFRSTVEEMLTEEMRYQKEQEGIIQRLQYAYEQDQRKKEQESAPQNPENADKKVFLYAVEEETEDGVRYEPVVAMRNTEYGISPKLLAADDILELQKGFGGIADAMTMETGKTPYILCVTQSVYDEIKKKLDVFIRQMDQNKCSIGTDMKIKKYVPKEDPTCKAMRERMPDYCGEDTEWW